jgi:hypothetical protein
MPNKQIDKMTKAIRTSMSVKPLVLMESFIMPPPRSKTKVAKLIPRGIKERGGTIVEEF